MNATIKATFWMTGSIASFSSMAVAGREVSSELDTFEIMMFRSLFGLLIVLCVAAMAGTLQQIRRDQMGLHTVRNLAHFTGQNLWFYAVTVIPLAQVFALEFTSPLWVIVLSPLILGEKLTPTRAFAALMGFLGILVVARPGVAGLNAGVVAAASSAVFFALSIMLTKKLTRTQTTTCILFYLTAMQLVFGVITAGLDGDVTWPSLAALPYVLMIGAAGLLAHFCLTNALTLAPATVVVPIDFIRLPTIAVVGMVLYRESVDFWVFAGAVIIFIGNYINILSETRGKSRVYAK